MSSFLHKQNGKKLMREMVNDRKPEKQMLYKPGIFSSTDASLGKLKCTKTLSDSVSKGGRTRQKTRIFPCNKLIRISKPNLIDLSSKSPYNLLSEFHLP